MTESFDTLAARAKEAWSQDTRAVYEAASEAFEAEMDQRQDPDQ